MLPTLNTGILIALKTSHGSNEKENPHHVGEVIYLVVEKLVYIALDHLQTKIKY